MTSSVLGTDIKTGQRVELLKASRRQGTYFIAATGVGKSTSLRYLIEQDIKQRIGVCVLDPHGDLIDDLIGSLHDKKDRDRVILLDAQDQNRVFGINLYQCDNPNDNKLVEDTRARVEHLFKLLWPDISTQPQVSQGIRNSTYAFIDSSPIYHCTMLELSTLFTEKDPRAHIVSYLRDSQVERWWQTFEGFDQGEKAKRYDMVVNKIEGYTTNRLLKPIIGQGKSTIDFRSVIDSVLGKIVLVRMYGDNDEMTQLIGSLLIAQLVLAAFSRQDTEKDKRRQFHIYCDEFERYATDDFTRLLKECRKYGMGMTIAHQSREDISLRNKAASLQVANIITGRVIVDDAKDIAPIFKADPKPGEKEYEQIYREHTTQELVKKYDPPEAEEKLKKKEEVKRQVHEYRRLLDRFIQDTNSLHLFTSDDDHLRHVMEYNKSEDDRRRYFYEYFNPSFLSLRAGGRDSYWTFSGLQEVFPSEAVKNALRPKPVPGERFFIIKDPSFYPSWDSIGNIAAGDTSKALVVSGSGFPRISDIPLTGDETDQQLLRVLTSLTKRIQSFDRRKQVLSVQQAIQSLLRPYQENAIYHFVPGVANKYKLREEARHRLEKLMRQKHITSYSPEWDHETDPAVHDLEYKELRRREEAIYSLLDDRRNYTLHHNSIYDSGGWRIQQYPRLWEWFKEEWRKHSELLALADALQKLDYKLDDEIRALRLTGKDVLKTVPVTYKSPTGEEYQVYVREEGVRAKVSHGFSETRDTKGFVTGRGESVNISEDKIPFYKEKQKDDEPIANVWNRRVDELTHLPVGAARCRVQNAAGEIEEHVIKLAMSTTRVENRDTVNKWIEEIKERMLKVDKTLRSIKDVEQEIAERHALLRQPVEQPILPEIPDRPQRRKPITG